MRPGPPRWNRVWIRGAQWTGAGGSLWGSASHPTPSCSPRPGNDIGIKHVFVPVRGRHWNCHPFGFLKGRWRPLVSCRHGGLGVTADNAFIMSCWLCLRPQKQHKRHFEKYHYIPFRSVCYCFCFPPLRSPACIAIIMLLLQLGQLMFISK